MTFELAVDCLLTGRRGGSSSSSELRVRSMTFSAGLFDDVERWAEDAVVDVSRDMKGGILEWKGLGVDIGSGFTPLGLKSEISMRSSLPQEGSGAFFFVESVVIGGSLSCAPALHAPVGSIVTCSIDLGVD